MSDVVAVDGQHTEQGLSQVERVVDTFIAPTKTFTDILRSTSWWLPFLLAVVVSLGVTYAIDKQVVRSRGGERDSRQPEAGGADIEPAAGSAGGQDEGDGGGV
jgi:hypothetical protein